MFSRSISAAVLSVAVCLPALGQTPAFPGALGFGANATGGRNGSVYHVTSLADSGPGSLRTGLTGGNRTIVFDVGGEIKLLTAISCSSSLTIAGQTAPGGIVINGGEISFANRNNIICRYLRIRPGSDTASTSDDALSFYRASNIIMDHTSIAFAPWNNIDGVGDSTHLVTDISIQNSINANPTGQQFGCHAESVGGQWSWQYNIFANSHNRNPLAKVNDTFINNLEYNNSAGYTTHTSTRFKHDIVNNYFIWGPASGGNFPWYQIDNNQSIYFTGNLSDSDKNGALGGGTTAPLPGYQGGGTILSAPWSSWTTIIPTMTPALAYRYNVSAAGAWPRDEVDSLIISQIKTLGTGGPGGSLYTSQTQTGLGNNGYGTLTGLTAPLDTDNDGMPDYWELATGSSTNVANPLTNTITGYTLLENYLNYLAAPHVVTQTNTAVVLNLSQFVSGFAASATFSLTNATNGTVSLLNGTNAQFVPAANFAGLGGFNFIVTEGSYSLNVAVAVCVTPVPPPASAVAFNGAIIGVTIATVSVPQPADLTWRGDGTANLWNTSVSNWFNDFGPTAYKSGDFVTLDDSGSVSPAINLTTTVSPGGFIFDSTNSYQISGSGSMSGSMSLFKSGSGSLTLFNPNSFTGGTVLNEGTLVLSNITAIGSGTLTLNGGTVSLIATGGPAQFAQPVAVAAPATIQVLGGAGFNNEAFNAAFTGNANLDFNIASGGTFSVRSGMTLTGYGGTIALKNSGTFRWQGGTGSATTGFDLGSNGVMIVRDGGAVTLGSLTGGPGSFLKGASGTAVITTNIIGGNNYSTTFAGQMTNGTISGVNALAIQKVGTGALTLTGTNYHSGYTAVTSGALIVNGSLTASPTTVSSSGTLTGAGYIGGLVSVSSGGRFLPGNNGPGTFTLGGGLTLNGGTVYFDLATVTNTGGGINDYVAMAGGALTLSGTTTVQPLFLGGPLTNGTYTLISGGSSTSGTTANLLWGGGSGSRQTIAFSTATAGTLGLVVSGTPAAGLIWRGLTDSNWDTATANWLNGATPDSFHNLDAVTFDNSGSGVPVITLSGTVSPAAIIVNANNNYTINGPGAYSGGGVLNKSGSGTLTINSTNASYFGNVNLVGGTLTLGNPSSLGSGLVRIASNATLNLAGSLIFPGNTVNVPPGETGTVTSSGGLGNGFAGFITGSSNSVLNISSGVSFSSRISSQFDDFAGTIHILPGGNLRYSSDSSGNIYGSLSPTMQVDGTLQPRDAGNTVQIGTLAGSGLLAGAQSNAKTGDTIFVIGGNNSDSLFSGNISSNSAVAGSDTDLIKVGTGKLTLTGVSTFGGGTAVNAGTLCIDTVTGSGSGTGDLEVSAGATLSGNGILASSVTIDGGATLAPGDPTGTLTISNSLTLNDSSVLQFALGTVSDSVKVSGNLFLTGQLRVTNAAGFGPGTYPLFTCGGALTFDNLTLVSAPPGYNYSFNTNTPGAVKLVVALPASPVFGNVSIIGNSLSLAGSNGAPFGYYYVQASSNLVSWKSIATNQFDANGAFNFTTNATPGVRQSFYRLQLQLP